MYQAKNEFNPDGLRSKTLIASIYFATNDHKLDWRDRRLLAKVAELLSFEVARGREPELTIVASCDSRGNESYNQWLSDQRLKAVTDSLGKLLSNGPGVTHVWAASTGEAMKVDETDGHASRKDFLARQREVSIFGKKWDLPRLLGGRNTKAGRGLRGIARYELGQGFVKRIEPPRVIQEELLIV